MMKGFFPLLGVCIAYLWRAMRCGERPFCSHCMSSRRERACQRSPVQVSQSRGSWNVSFEIHEGKVFKHFPCSLKNNRIFFYIVRLWYCLLKMSVSESCQHKADVVIGSFVVMVEKPASANISIFALWHLWHLIVHVFGLWVWWYVVVRKKSECWT